MNCFSLEYIISHSEIPPVYCDPESSSTDIFSDYNFVITPVYVPKELIDLYKNHDTWKIFTTFRPLDDIRKYEEYVSTDSDIIILD